LLELGANADAQPGTFGTALCTACDGPQDVEMVKLILASGPKDTLNKACGTIGTPLHIAASSGHYDTVAVLLGAGADPNAPGGSFGDALQAASVFGHEEIVELLLEHGAKVDQ
ncbi:ankyrin, partial [Cucurbitaria berberidis CBS 394.84]